MSSILKATAILFSLLATHVLGDLLCRRCHGQQTVIFTNQIPEATALTWFKSSLGACATGNELATPTVFGTNCQVKSDGSYCKDYDFQTTLYRYCGIGGDIDYKTANECIAGVCSVSSERKFTCTEIVACHGTCTCAQCGC